MLTLALLLPFVVVASVTDVRWGKIPNALTYPGMLVGVGLNLVASTLAWAGVTTPQTLAGEWFGLVGIASSVLGLLACGGILVVCLVVFGEIGGGDIKLLALMGAFLGVERGVVALLWTIVLGACLGLVLVVWRVGAPRLASWLWFHLRWRVRLGSRAPFSKEEQQQLRRKIYLGPAALAGVLVVYGPDLVALARSL